MKLVSLNTYGGYCFEPLIEFIEANASSTDIFCFQEMLTTGGAKALTPNGMRADLFSEIARALPDFSGFYTPVQEYFDSVGTIDQAVTYGLAIFIKKQHAAKKIGDVFIFGEGSSYVSGRSETLPCKLQYIELEIYGNKLTICNVHGTSEPGNKLDTPERLAQSKKILDFAEHKPGEKIIVGDFNLMPDTRSVGLFEERGFHNLVKDFAITSTRGSLRKQLHPEFGTGPFGWQEFADYAFASPGITVLNFQVPDVPISDHLPLILKFEMRG